MKTKVILLIASLAIITFEHQKEWIAGLYTRTITTALHWKRVCRFLVSGVISIERTGMEPFELDFGTGECDAVATVTMGGESKEITLRYRHRLMGK